jgi:hypothetical protein
VITKVLVSAASALAAAIGVAAPASADPSTFSNLSCSSCAGPVSVTSPAVIDQVNDGIREGFSDLRGFGGWTQSPALARHALNGLET